LADRSVDDILQHVKGDISAQISNVQDLAKQASQQPYYKWNNVWSRAVQDVLYTMILTEWLRGSDIHRLLTLEDLGETMKLPINVTDRDAFHLTIEEYLLAVVSLVDELARLARNAVTLGDHSLPLQISSFVKNIHEGFQLLNLKNDILRKRSDGIKYRVWSFCAAATL
jgi:hypothetical protein